MLMDFFFLNKNCISLTIKHQVIYISSDDWGDAPIQHYKGRMDFATMVIVQPHVLNGGECREVKIKYCSC